MAAAIPGSEASRSVLIVEDEPDICELMSDVLDTAGFQACCVASDRDAYALLSEPRSFAAVIVDINLGVGVTGFDVARFARKQDPRVPVLFVSGQASEKSFRAFGVSGAVFLPKPFAPADLLQRFGDLIGEAG